MKTYQEVTTEYKALFRKYPHTLNLYTGNEEKAIPYKVQNYEKRGNRWTLTEEHEEVVTYINYYNVVDPRATAFFKSLGGTEKNTVRAVVGYGYIPVKVESTNPDRTKKTVRRFFNYEL